MAIERSDGQVSAPMGRREKQGLVWAGVIIIMLLLLLLLLLLLTPTLGTHGPASGSAYAGERFFCAPAVLFTTDYPVNMWEEWPEDLDGPTYGRYARADAEVAFQIAVCGEQRSRRVGWALVVVLATLLVAQSIRTRQPDTSDSRSSSPDREDLPET